MEFIKERIVLAYYRLLPNRGFSRVTMDELASEAGLSKRTIYRYFSSKEEIIEAVIDSFLKMMGEKADKVLESEKQPEEIFKSIINTLVKKGHFMVNKTVLGDLQQHYPEYWDRIDSFRVKKVKKVIDTIYKQEENYVKTHIDPQIIVAVFTASIQAVLNPEFLISQGMSIEEAAHQLSQMLQYGIFGKKQPLS